MKNIGCINPELIFWIKLGLGMYIALEILGTFFHAVGVI